jgi:hypothetical protein
MAVTLYYTEKLFTTRKITFILFAAIGIAGMMVFRGVYLLVFIPAFLSWILACTHKFKAVLVFASVYIISGIIFFGSPIISGNNNLPVAMVARQREFFQLHGKTLFKLDSLEPSFQSFLKIAPQAFSNTFLRPAVWEAKGFLQIVSALDIIAFWGFVIFVFYSPAKDWKMVANRPLPLLFLFYGFSLALMIGYIVPFPGAIVRYKSIPELLLLAAFGVAANFKILKL